MNLLIFLVSVFYYLIFFFFYLVSYNKNLFWYNFSWNVHFDSLSWNLIFEAIFFVILGTIFYLFFSDFSFKKSEKNDFKEAFREWKILTKFDNYVDKVKIYNFLSVFFKNYLYYIWFVFIYLSIYFIYKSYSVESFSYIIFLLNLVVLVWFFISNKFFIFRDFIKINVILFSIYYFVFYLTSFFEHSILFPFIDIINSIFVLISFLLVFYNDSEILNYKKLDNSLLIYFFIFIFTFLSFSFYSILNTNLFEINTSFILSIISFILSVLVYFLFLKIKFFVNNKVILRIISFLFWYLSSIIMMIYFIKYSFNIVLFLIMIYFIIFNFNIHNKYENYISFFFSNLILVFLIYFSYHKLFYSFDDGIIFLILSLVLSLEGIVLTYFYDFKYDLDYYFFHIFSYLVNFISIVFYLIVFKIDLFTLWIIFFIESIYIFLSYYRLKKINNLKLIKSYD